MMRTGDNAQGSQTTGGKASRRGSRSNKLDKADRDLASAGGAAPDQGKQQPTAEQHNNNKGGPPRTSNINSNNTSAADHRPHPPVGRTDTTPSAGDVPTPSHAGAGALSSSAGVADKFNPKRWAAAWGSVTSAGGSSSSAGSMPPGRKQQQQQQHPQQAVGQMQQYKAQTQPPQAGTAASQAPATSAGKGAPVSGGPGKTAAQQAQPQPQAKPARVARTVSNSSNEASTPVQGSQRGSAAGGPAADSKLQQQQQQAESSSSTAPKAAQLSYAAAALTQQQQQQQPRAAPAAAARARKPAPAAPAAQQEAFPPLSPSSKPSPDSWGSPASASAMSASGWGSSNGSSKPWGPQQAEPSNGKAEVVTSQAAAKGSTAAGTAPGMPAAQGKAADANGVGRDDSHAPKQSNGMTANGISTPAGGAGGNRPDGNSQRGSHGGRGGDSSGRGGRGGHSGNVRQSGSVGWAAKQQQQQQADGQPQDQQGGEHWVRQAAAYRDETISKQSAKPAPAAQEQPAGVPPQQQASKETKGSGPRESVAAKDTSTGTQYEPRGRTHSKAAGKGLNASGVTKPSPPASNKGPAPTPAAAPGQQQDTSSAVPAQEQPVAAVSMGVVHGAASGPAAQAPSSALTAAQASAAVTQHGAAAAASTAPHAASTSTSHFGPDSSTLPPKADVTLAGKLPKQQQQQHSPAVKLPSSQAVNMAAIAARHHGVSDDVFGAHYGNMDSFGVSPAYQAPGASNYPSGMQAAAALSSFMPLYQQPAAPQLPTAVGDMDFLLGPSANSSSAFKEAPYAPDTAAGPQPYGSVPEPQAPAGMTLHSAAAGPSSTGSRNSNSSAPQRGGVNMKRHLSADAPPFEVPSRTSGGSNSGNGSSAAGDASGSGQRVGSRGPGRGTSVAGSGSSSHQGNFSRQLFDLAEQMQAVEQAHDVECAEAARRQVELEDGLRAEKEARLAAESRLAALKQELEASHQRNKDLEQQCALESNRASRLQEDLAAQAAEAQAVTSRAGVVEAELHDAKQQLEDMQARMHSLQQQCQALEADKLQLQHSVNTQSRDAARQVADAAVAAAAAAAPVAAGRQHLHSNPPLHSQGHGHGVASVPAHGGIATRLPPPGFEPVPLHPQHAPQQQHQQQQQQQLHAPGTSNAAAGSAAGAPAAAPQADLGVGRPQAPSGAGPDLEMNEHQLVLTFLSRLPTDPNLALKFADTEAVSVNVKLMPLNWDEHYAFRYGSMQNFMKDRPMVFGIREDGAFYKYSNSEDLVQQKMAQEAKQPAAGLPSGDSSSQGGGFVPSQGPSLPQQQHVASAGGWHSQSAPMDPGQHSMHSGPPSGPGMFLHAMSMPMGPPAGMGAGMHPTTAHMPYFPYPMLHSMPASMPLAGPSMGW